METFYDIDSSDDLKELWESELDPEAMQEVLRLNSSGDMTVEWNYMDKELSGGGLVLHDKLMTDAALGTRPIKTEHSYSLASDGDSLPDSPIAHNNLDEMDEDCFPTISMNSACERMTTEEDDEDDIQIKDEPISESESTHSSCPSSPRFMNTSELHYDDIAMRKTTHSLLKHQTNIMLTSSSPHCIIPQRIQMPKMNIKIEPNSNVGGGGGGGFQLPPTPPSCSSSEDSEDNATVYQPPSPGSRKATAGRMILSHHTSTRQPIHTPLISSQPKGSTGTLILTEEEKRTLIAEGYPVPTRLPLTKSEEKSLKKIRRKIKNKISAQESRRKKKEYMDQLERKVEMLVSENSESRTKIESLEDSNRNLMSQLQKLQAIVARTHPHIIKQVTTITTK